MGTLKLPNVPPHPVIRKKFGNVAKKAEAYVEAIVTDLVTSTNQKAQLTAVAKNRAYQACHKVCR